MSTGGLFSFRPELGETPETLKRRRAIAEQLMAGSGSVPTTLGGGLSSFGKSIAGALMARAADRQAAAGAASVNPAFSSMISGGPGVAAPSGTTAVTDALVGSGGADVLSGGGNADFIASMTPYAKSVAAKTGLDPNLILAQTALETGWGKKAAGNNYFGIKGPGQVTPTREFVNGQPIATSASFRAYDTPEASFDDYADFISGDRYAGVRSAKTLEDQARALQAAGYATDPEYANKLIGIGNRLRGGGGTGAAASTTPGGGGYIDLSGLAQISQSDAASGVGAPMQQPRGLVIHHTGGRGGAQDVVGTLNQRGFSVQYVIDRDGKIYQTLPEGARGQHIKNAKNGFSNDNAFGVEVIANDDSDVTPAQIAAARKLAGDLGSKYGFGPDSVFGHGEINPHKQATEGSTIVNAIRGGGAGGVGVPAVTAALAGTEPVASAEPAAMTAAGLGPGPGAGPAIREPLAAPVPPPGPGAGPPIREPLGAPVPDPRMRPAVPPAAAAVAPAAPAVRARGIDPLPQTSGLVGPVAAAGHETLSPGAQAVTAALAGGGGADALAGGAGRGLFRPRGAAAPGSTAASVAGGGGGAPSVAATGTAAPGFSPRAQAAITVLQNPWANPGQQALAKTILDQEIQQADPKYRVDLEAAREALRQAQTPSRSLTDAEKRDRGLDPSLDLQIDARGNVTELPSVKTTMVGNRVFNSTTGEELWRAPPGTKLLTPDEAKTMRLPVGAGNWMVDENGKPAIIPGTEPSDPEYNDYVREALAAREAARASGVAEADLPPLPVDRLAWRKGGAGSVSVSTGDTAEAAFSKKFGEKGAENFFERRDTALDAALSLEANNEARSLLDQGLITGAGAEWIVGFDQAIKQLGFNEADDASANTQAYVATRAQEVGRIIKMFGAGTGLSDADREYARQAAAGDITLDERAIRHILDINDRAVRNVIRRFNADASKIDPKISPFPLTIDMPPAYVSPKNTNDKPKITPADIPPDLEKGGSVTLPDGTVIERTN